ncbi:MAG: PIN domain-containing protein [Dethiobacter sp.]|jgi:predicted nucleic acid-binding protein|nr:MAG: PIN domain-containing protein [Dethiobacter sp.]
MSSNPKIRVLYWDTSAIISALLKDEHSEQALNYAHSAGVHLISSLALAETHAVLSRIRRERLLADILNEACMEALEKGPWRQLLIVPGTAEIKILAKKWPLRGADLWHLAAVKTLQKELPELLMLTFDHKLYDAANSEQLALELR